MTLTNAPTNATGSLQTPRQTTMQTHIQTQQTPQQTPYTQTPYNPRGVCMRLARAFYPPANTAALALRSRSQAPDRSDLQATAEQDDRSPTRPMFGNGRLERPRHPISRVDIQHRAIQPIDRGCRTGLAARVTHAFARADRTTTAPRLTTHKRPRQRALGPILGPARQRDTIATSKINRFASRRHRFGHSVQRAKGIYARDVAASFTLVERKGRARASGCWRNVEAGEAFAGIGGSKDPLGMPGARNLLGRQIIDLSSRYSTALLKILGGPAVQNLAAAGSENPGGIQ